MGTELQKQPSVLPEIVKQSYLDSQAKAVAHLLDIAAQTYGNMELTPALVSFWKEALQDLSPNQIRDGLLAYMKSDRGCFKPTPADIIGHAPEATDKPRKVYDDDCPNCEGTGFRRVLVDSKLNPGTKAQKVTDCYCTRIEYEGHSHEVKKLPPAPDVKQDGDILAQLAKEIPQAKQAMKPWPPERREQSEEEYNRRKEELRVMAERLKNS